MPLDHTDLNEDTGFSGPMRLAPLRLVQFAAIQLACCVFPIAVLVGLAASVLIWQRFQVPMARYDALLVYVVVVQLILVAAESRAGASCW